MTPHSQCHFRRGRPCRGEYCCLRHGRWRSLSLSLSLSFSIFFLSSRLSNQTLFHMEIFLLLETAGRESSYFSVMCKRKNTERERERERGFRQSPRHRHCSGPLRWSFKLCVFRLIDSLSLSFHSPSLSLLQERRNVVRSSPETHERLHVTRQEERKRERRERALSEFIGKYFGALIRLLTCDFIFALSKRVNVQLLRRWRPA